MLEEIPETTEPDAGARRRTSNDPGQRRELEEAPLLLRKASVVLMIGALFPWMTALATQGKYMPWGGWFAGIALTLLAGWILLESAKANAGQKASGVVKPIAGAHPMAGPIVALLVFIGACVFALMVSPAGWEAPVKASEQVGNEPSFGLRAVAELTTLFLALGTFAHIVAYEFGGKFNPIFPLMFFGPAIAGLLNILGAFKAFGDNPLAILSLLGSIIVAAGGLMAAYTMYVSMKQAKIEGDKKRAMMRERKKQERSARRSR